MFNADCTEYTSRRLEVVRSEPYAPPTVESIREGERLMAQPACTSDRCKSGRKDCPTPLACQLPDPEEVHRGPLAWIVAGFVLGVLGDLVPKTTAGRVLLAVLTVPALAGVVALVAMVWGR